MFCKNCGNQLGDGAMFCTVCGASVAPTQTTAQAPVQEPTPVFTQEPVSTFDQSAVPPVTPTPAPAYTVNNPTNMDPNFAGVQYAGTYAAPTENEEVKSKEASSTLTFGILGVAFACTFWLSFLGIIFSGIALSKANAFRNKYGKLIAKASVGRGLGIGGLIGSIVLTVIFVLYILLIVLIIDSASDPYYYDEWEYMVSTIANIF